MSKLPKSEVAKLLRQELEAFKIKNQSQPESNTQQTDSQAA